MTATEARQQSQKKLVKIIKTDTEEGIEFAKSEIRRSVDLGRMGVRMFCSEYQEVDRDVTGYLVGNGYKVLNDGKYLDISW